MNSRRKKKRRYEPPAGHKTENLAFPLHPPGGGGVIGPIKRVIRQTPSMSPSGNHGHTGSYLKGEGFHELSCSVTSPLYDHLVITTIFFRPKRRNHLIILKTPLMRPPRYYNQDVMAQRW